MVPVASSSECKLYIYIYIYICVFLLHVRTFCCMLVVLLTVHLLSEILGTASIKAASWYTG